MVKAELEAALNELGVLGPETPAPVANAVGHIETALEEVKRMMNDAQEQYERDKAST